MFNNVNSGRFNSNWWNVANTQFFRTLTHNTGLPTMPNLNPGNNANTPDALRASVMEIRRGADSLQAAIRGMQGVGRGVSSPFGIANAVSSEPDTLRITGFDANRLRQAGVSGFTVDVQQVARAQRNEGQALDAGGLDFAAGNQHISLNVGNRQFDFNVNVNANDTNRDVQQRIASAVNARSNQTGVRASVVFDDDAQTSSLVFESTQTGVNVAGQPNFTIGGGSDALGVLAMNTVTQQAQNAEFRVNRNGFTGSLQTSRTNDVDLGFGITGQLRDAGEAQVTLGRNEAAQIASFREIVDGFNSLMTAAQRNANAGDGANARGREASPLERNLIGVFNTYASALNRIGVSMGADGFLRVNEEQMRSAAESGALERFATDGGRGNFGFINRLDRIADNAMRNPARVATPPQALQPFNPQINHMTNIGLLLDTLF